MLMQREATLPAVVSAMPQALPGPVANPPAIVMELVAGRSLGSAIAAKSDLVTSRLARVVYALDTAKAMSYLHSRQVAHLDLKSGNVLLGWRDRRPTAKIAGYGLTGRKVSMVRCAAQGVTSSASMLPWVAPEVFRTPEYVTGKADVYSFAVLMWELWALKTPFEGWDPLEVLARVQEGEVVRPPLPGTDGEPPAEEPGPGWRDLIERCWAEDPEQRPDFSVIEEELRGIAREVKRQQAPGRPRPGIPLPRAGSRPALLRRTANNGNAGGGAARRQGSTAPAAAEPGAVVPAAAGPLRQGSGDVAAAGGEASPHAPGRSPSAFLIMPVPETATWAPKAEAEGRPPEAASPSKAAAAQHPPPSIVERSPGDTGGPVQASGGTG